MGSTNYRGFGFAQHRLTKIAATAVAGALLLVACGSDDEAATTTAAAATADSAADAPAPAGDGPKIFVIGGKSDDPFWSKVKRGVDDAAIVVEQYGGSVTWLGPQNYDNLGPDAAKLAETAAAQGAD